MLDLEKKLPLQEDNSTSKNTEKTNDQETEKVTDKEVTKEIKEDAEKVTDKEVTKEIKEDAEKVTDKEVAKETKEDAEKVTDKEVAKEIKEDAEKVTDKKVVKESKEDAEKVTDKKVVKESKEEISTNKAIDEIEDKIAESSENDESISAKVVDYNNFTLEELVDELSKLLNENQVQTINDNVNKIKNVFNKKYGEILKTEKEKFIAEGGNIIDFQYSIPVKTKYNSLLYDYKVKKTEYYSNQEKKLKENLETKLEIIEDLKRLIDNSDDGGVMYKNFRKIQEKWRNVGPIPRAKYNDTWRTYHHHVERFYDLLHISNDLRDLDFKHNLEEKLKLVEKAENLTEIEDINVAFKKLQVLHKIWKEDVGPVSHENREVIWGRFSTATRKIHDKKHAYYKEQRSKYDENIQVKLELIEKIDNLPLSDNETRKDWLESIKKIDSLREKFFSIGYVPKSKNKEIWNKFREATRKFNIEKNKFFKSAKKEYLDNLNKKKILIEQAKSLKDSEDWEMATDMLKRIQSDWKKIGHVPRKYSDKIWKEFKDTCNHYFDRLHAKQDNGTDEEVENYSKKKEFLNNLKISIENKEQISSDIVKNYIDDWRDLGNVSKQKRHIDFKFNKIINQVIKNSDVDKDEIEIIKFSNLMNNYLNQNNYRKLDSEQLYIRKKIDETVREINQLENNIGFISNVSEDSPLVKNIRDQINEYNDKLNLWKSKLQYMRNMDY